jgi:multidrug transporter EmrE-like cation transporter
MICDLTTCNWRLVPATCDLQLVNHSQVTNMHKLEVSSAMIGTLLLGLVSIMLLSAGQTSLKYGLNAIGGVSLADGFTFLKLFQTPWVIVGFVLYGLSSILWLDVLSKLEFSLAFPMVGLTYVFTLLIGRFFFGETIGWERMLGVALIIGGVFFLVRSGR